MSTSLKELDLVHLKKVSNGKVIIAANADLCYVNETDLSFLKELPEQSVLVRQNKNATVCGKLNKT